MLLTAALVVTPHMGYSQNANLARPELIERLEGALEIVGRGEPGLRAQLLAALALELQFVGEVLRRGPLCDEAYDLAVESDETAALAAAFRARFFSGRQTTLTAAKVEQQRVGHLELLERALVAGDDDLATECYNMAWFDALYLADRADADDIQERARELAARRPTPLALRLLAHRDTIFALVDGDLERAGSCQAQWAALLDGSLTTDGTEVVLFTLALEGGYVELAIPALEDAVATVPQQALVRAMLAVTCVETGRTDQANELFDWFVDDGCRTIPDDTIIAPTLGMWLEVGWALRRADRLEAMTTWLGLVEGHPVLLTGILYLGATDRVRGLVARLSGDDDAAVEYFRSAVALDESLGAVPMAAAARNDWAELLPRPGPHRAGRGAGPDHSRVHRRPPARSSSGRARAVLDRVEEG